MSFKPKSHSVSPGIKTSRIQEENLKVKKFFNLNNYQSPNFSIKKKETRNCFQTNNEREEGEKNIYSKNTIVTKSGNFKKFLTLKREMKKSKSQDWFSIWNRLNKIKKEHRQE